MFLSVVYFTFSRVEKIIEFLSQSRSAVKSILEQHQVFFFFLIMAINI